MGTYKAKQRRQYATVGDDGYPIGDEAHARLALNFIDKGDLSSAEKVTVRAKAARFWVKSGAKTPAKQKKGMK